MSKLLPLILSFIILASGCCTPLTPDSIIKRNYDNYVENSSGKDSHYEMDIALRNFIYGMIGNPPSGWKDVIVRKDIYLKEIKERNISPNYPIIVKRKEIKIIRHFLQDLIDYGEKEGEEASSNEIITFLSSMTQRFIVEVDEYEYVLEGFE